MVIDAGLVRHVQDSFRREWKSLFNSFWTLLYI